MRALAILLSACGLGLVIAPVALAQQCPASVPVQGAPPPAPLPLFPANNWWNTDIRTAPVDPGSAGFIAFLNNGGTRHLHPDFGGEESPGSTAIYGFPYAVVDGTQPKQSVTFDYWDESDGVDPSTGKGVPFYPIPAQAIAQAHWVEGGSPANVDERSQSDRHLLIIDCSRRYLYELYNVYYQPSTAQWLAGSGAFFDMNSNGRRPDTWTSADAAGLAIFPGLVRYDDAANSAVTDIGHAFRVTVRTTNGYVYPASHLAGTTAGALPMGARLRLKTSVNGVDPALRTTDATSRKIFRAMQKYGLIVADNGSDLYISGTFDVRWNNDVLNPAFATLTANDFDVIQLGWKPPAHAAHDFNGDGRSDILWRDGGQGRNAIWLSANASTVRTVASVPDLQWHAVGVADFNGDGIADILWRNASTGANVIWRSGNSATTQPVAAVVDPAWKVAGVGDFNGDGKADILWRNSSSGADSIWNSADSSMVQTTAGVTDQDWQVAGIGDFNGDNHADILWRNQRSGADVIWKSANVATRQTLASVTNMSWHVVAVADFNGDGNADIFWRNASGGANVIWRSGSASSQQAVTSIADAAWTVAGNGDYNADGRADVLWRNQSTGANVIWKSADSTAVQTVGSLMDVRWATVR